jgi:hypothetical protein
MPRDQSSTAWTKLVNHHTMSLDLEMPQAFNESCPHSKCSGGDGGLNTNGSSVVKRLVWGLRMSCMTNDKRLEPEASLDMVHLLHSTEAPPWSILAFFTSAAG